jgi:glyoxylase I family protein
MKPSLTGLSHLSLSVSDLAAVTDFWVDVFGFESLNDDPRFRLLLHRETRMAVIVTDHGGAVTGPFDERNPGLDHVALAVGDTDSLVRWQADLEERGIINSGIVESEAGHHLNLRGPGNLPIELFVLNGETAEALGLPAARCGVRVAGR